MTSVSVCLSYSLVCLLCILMGSAVASTVLFGGGSTVSMAASDVLGLALVGLSFGNPEPGLNSGLAKT